MAKRLCLYFLAHIDKVWNIPDHAKNTKTVKSLYQKLKNWSDNHPGQPITTRYMISSKFANNTEEAVKLLDNLESQGKGSWVDDNKREFQLVA